MPDVTLRPVIPDDLPVFFDNMRDPVAIHMAAFTSKDPNDRAAFDAHWARSLAAEDGLIRTIVVDNQVAGSVLSYVHDGETEVSYWIGREYWGQSIATTALKAFLVIETTRPLYARAVKDNAGSLRVLEKCGFAIIGEDKGFANGRGEEVEEFILRLV
jgi:RimJ/RimL family protein N-acetyltransferase